MNGLLQGDSNYYLCVTGRFNTVGVINVKWLPMGADKATNTSTKSEGSPNGE